MFKYLDLFAGIGGFHIASDKNGGQCVAFSEIAKDAIDFYCKNHKKHNEKLQRHRCSSDYSYI